MQFCSYKTIFDRAHVFIFRDGNNRKEPWEFTSVPAAEKRERVIGAIRHKLQNPQKAAEVVYEQREALIRKTREAVTNKLLAFTDKLTRIGNKRRYLERIEQEMARAEREGQPLGLLFLDFDHFKNVNDTHGHPAGDRTLRKGASILKAHIRVYDEVCRIGGEEFAVILSDVNADQLANIAENLRKAVEDETAHTKIPITISIGSTVFEPENADKMNRKKLEKQADIALYASKRNGRNRVTRFAKGMTKRNHKEKAPEASSPAMRLAAAEMAAHPEIAEALVEAIKKGQKEELKALLAQHPQNTQLLREVLAELDVAQAA